MIERKEIEELFKELLDQMEDKELAKKTVDTFMLGIEEGGWDNVEKLKRMPFTLLTNTCGVNFIEHTIAVTKGAIYLAKAQMETYVSLPYEINMDRLIAGGILHDVGKLLEIQPKMDGTHFKSHNGMCTRHPISGAILAAKAGLDDEMINTIACHAKEGDGRPQVIETVFIHQADFATFNPLVMKQKGTLIQ